MPFVFADTNTERVDFRKVFAGNIKFPKAYHQTLNEARQRVCDTLASQPSSQSLLDVAAIDEYLPHVLSMIDVAEKDKLVEIEYAWKSVMTVGTVSGLGKIKASEKKTIRCSSIYYEAIYIMIAYSLALANIAEKRVGSQPSFSAETTINEAIEMYCKASGILSMLSNTWAARWTATKNRPPETTTAGLTLLSEFMLLEAQMLAVVKAEKRGMSISTIIKLQRGVLEKFETAKSAFRNAKGDWSDVFRLYIEEGAYLYEAMMLKKYAAHCHSEDKNGVAVSCMTRCYNLFQIELKSIKTPTWAKIHTECKDDLRQTLDTYTRINNHVTYDKIPSDEEMMAALPPATCLVDRKAFTMPQAAEIPEPTEEELAAATAALEIGKKKDKKEKKQSSDDGEDDESVEDKNDKKDKDKRDKKKSKSPPPSEEEEDDEEVSSNKNDGAPKASVKSAFKSLFKLKKEDVK